MAAGIEQVFHMIFILGFHADDALAAAMLGLVGAGRHTLDVTGIGHGDHAAVLGNQVSNIEVTVIHHDFGTPGIGIFIPDHDQFITDHAQTLFAAGQQTFKVSDLLLQFGIFIADILHGHAGQLVQTHIQNRLHLHFGKTETIHQRLCRFRTGTGVADHLNHFIQIIQSQQEAFQNVGTGTGFLQIELRPARNHFQTVIDVSLQDFRKVHHDGAVMIHHQHGTADGSFQRSMGVQLIEHHRTHHTTLNIHHDPHPGTVTGFVPQVSNAGHLLVADEVSDLHHQIGLVDSVRNFSNDDLFTTVFFHDFSLGTHLHAAVTGSIKLTQGITAADSGAGGEVRTGQKFHQFIHSGTGIIHQSNGGIDDFAQVMRRNIGCHTHTDTGTAVHQQIGETGRQNAGFLFFFVKVGNHLNGFFFDIAQQFFGQAFHTAFGITGGGSRVPVNRTEVPLTFDQRITHGKVLRQTHESIINGGIPVGVVFPHHFPDHTGTLGSGTALDQIQHAHGVQDTPVHRLEPVPHVRDGPAHVHTQRILQISSMHDLINIKGNIPAGQIIAHNHLSQRSCALWTQYGYHFIIYYIILYTAAGVFSSFFPFFFIKKLRDPEQQKDFRRRFRKKLQTAVPQGLINRFPKFLILCDKRILNIWILA